MSYIPRSPLTTYTDLFDDYMKKLSSSCKRGKIDTRDLPIIHRCDTTRVKDIRLNDGVIAKLNSRVLGREQKGVSLDLSRYNWATDRVHLIDAFDIFLGRKGPLRCSTQSYGLITCGILDLMTLIRPWLVLTLSSFFFKIQSPHGVLMAVCTKSYGEMLKRQDKMSRDVITVGSTMRISLLYRGEYSQWCEKFMNYLEEKTDGEAMINSTKNGDQPLPVIALVNETAKDLWDALERQMRGFEYGEQDRKTAILYEYETFKATEGEQLLDTYLHYLQVINDLKKCGYKKDNCELNYKFLNNLQLEWKQYGTLMRQTKNLMDINIDALYNILKQNQGDVNDAL
nr:hypothetical protein [Tanacetum cinerariifolium]